MTTGPDLRTTPRMSINSIHHHGFTVTNLERSLSFYRDALGLKLERISNRKNLPTYDHILGYKDVHLKVAILTHPANSFVLELFQYINPPGQQRLMSNYFVGSSHVAFGVKDVNECYKRICESGFGAINAPIDIERDGRRVARAIYALDPDGISVELFQAFEELVGN